MNFQSRFPLVKLVAVAPITTERVSKFNGLKPYVATADVQDSKIVASVDVDYKNKPSRADISVKANDVTFARMQSTNKVLMIGNTEEKYIFSTGFAVCRPTQKILPKYLKYWFVSDIFNEQKDSYCTGATQKAIPNSGIEKIFIPLPSLPEQERIVRLLDEAEALRATRARANARLEQFVPALFQEMFGDPATNSKKWEIAITEKLFSKSKAGTKCGPFGSALKKSEYVNSGIPVWGIDNVQENEFIEENSLFITQKKFEELSSYSVDVGDILISRAGTVGRMCVAYPRQSPSIIGTNLIRLSFDQNKVVPEYFTAMAMYFSNSLGNLRANADETAYSFVSTKTLKSLLIPVPPLALQREFAARVSEARGVQSAQARSAERIEALYQSMLSRAFAGEL